MYPHVETTEYLGTWYSFFIELKKIKKIFLKLIFTTWGFCVSSVRLLNEFNWNYIVIKDFLEKMEFKNKFNMLIILSK